MTTRCPENKASNRQVEGSHYKDFAIQPGEFCQRNRLNMMESLVIKYICRHGAKGRAVDIDKAIHCLQLLKEWEYPESTEHEAFNRPFQSTRRGEQEVYAFAEAIIETLNLPKNSAKGGWDSLSLGELMDRMKEEEDELNDALFNDEGRNLDPKSEATDVAAFAMMIFDRLKKGNRNG